MAKKETTGITRLLAKLLTDKQLEEKFIQTASEWFMCAKLYENTEADNLYATAMIYSAELKDRRK